MSAAPQLVELAIPADHAAFAGHFPGFPILPGAVLLDRAVHEIARSRDLDLENWNVTVKFLGMVRPGDALTLEHSAANAATIRFAVRTSSGTVASGMLSGRPATPGP